MLKRNFLIILACAIAGCAASGGRDGAFSEWRSYELGSEREPPTGYRLDGNDEICRAAPLSECVYRNGSLSLSYHDGRLISKEAVVTDALVPDPLVQRLASARDKGRVVAILEEQGVGYPPACFDLERSHECGVLVKRDPSEYLEARFTSEWELTSIFFNVPDAL